MNFFLSRIADEPVAFASLVRIGILCAMAFGLTWSPAQLAAVMALVEGAAVFFTRKAVTPNATVRADALLANKVSSSGV